MKKLSTLKYLMLLGAVAGVLGFASPVLAATDTDSDSVPDVVENSSTPNAGDNNYDGAQDSQQNTVATITNPNDTASPNAFVTLQVGNTSPCGGSVCTDSAWNIDQFKAVDVATLPSQPDGKVFPVGMFDIKLSCKYPNVTLESRVGGCVEYSIVDTGDDGQAWVPAPIPANLKLIFDRVMDTSNWTTQKYDPTSNTYTDYSANVTISNQTIGYLRTVLEWSLTDGGVGDTDGVVNNSISDPIGPSVPVAPVTVAEVKPAVAPKITGPTLAFTGVDTQMIVLAGFFLITSGAVLLPKKG